MTGESAGIDEIMDRVEGLALPLNKVISTTRAHELRFGGGVKKTRADLSFRRESSIS